MLVAKWHGMAKWQWHGNGLDPRMVIANVRGLVVRHLGKAGSAASIFLGLGDNLLKSKPVVVAVFSRVNRDRSVRFAVYAVKF